MDKKWMDYIDQYSWPMKIVEDAPEWAVKGFEKYKEFRRLVYGEEYDVTIFTDTSNEL